MGKQIFITLSVIIVLILLWAIYVKINGACSTGKQGVVQNGTPAIQPNKTITY